MYSMRRLHHFRAHPIGRITASLARRRCVNAHRFIYDSRDTGAAELKALGSPDGVWRCRTVFNCTLGLPRGIKITKAIADVDCAPAGWI